MSPTPPPAARRPLPLPWRPPEGGKGQEQQSQEARQPKEEPNNLLSRSYARLLFLLSEGQIDGLCTRSGAKITNPAQLGQAVYLNGTAVIEPNGRRNFAGVQVAQVFGTQNQPAITGFAAAEETIQLGQELKHGVPVTVEITPSETTALLVAVKVSQLFEQIKKTGDIKGTEVKVQVQIYLNGAGTPSVTRVVKIKGKTQSEYVQEVGIRLPNSSEPTEDTWTVVIARLTEDSGTLLLQNGTSLSYITRVVGDKLRYPNSANVAVQFDAKAFNSLPTVAFHARGMRVLVPSNYFPDRRKYTRNPLTGADTGVEQPWNGTFWRAWSQNPAWCLYDLVTNTRYGLGDYVQLEQVDKWTMYQVGRYCDQMVTNLVTGRKEPRFMCNVYFQERSEAIKATTDMASIFRGFVYWAAGTVVTIHDAPKTPLVTFNQGNVEGGLFTYSSTALRGRHTVCYVRWNDPSDFYNAKMEYVPDDDGIAQFGIRPLEITGFGITRKGQAVRMGKWALATELLETNLVRFTTGLEGLYPRPGDVIKIMDPGRAGVRHGGRLGAIAGDRLSVTLDKEVTLEVGATYTLHLYNPSSFLPPGTSLASSDDLPSLRPTQLLSKTVTTGAGTAAVLSFSGALPADVEVGTAWGLETPTLLGQTFRVLSVKEQGANKYEIEALEHNPGKFNAIENNLRLDAEQITRLPNLGFVADPQNLRATVGFNDTPELFVRFILLSWTPPLNTQLRGYVLEARRDLGNWVYVAEVTSPSYSYNFTEKGSYEFRLFAVNAVGVRSSGVTVTVPIDETQTPTRALTVTGLEVVGPDGNGKGLDATFTGRNVALQWRVNSPVRSYDFGDELFGAAGQIDDPYFQDFEVRVFAVGAGNPSWYETTKSPHFDFTYEKNAEAFGGASNVFTVQVRARDVYNNTGAAAVLTVQNPAPAEPTFLTLQTAFRSAFLHWGLPAEPDLSHTEVWLAEGVGSDFDDATHVADVPASGSSSTWSYLNLTTGASYRFWLRSVDTFGSTSNAFPPAGSAATPGSIPVSDLDKLATDLTGIFNGTVIPKGAVWSDNTPAAGRIAWNAHQIGFAGTLYPISAGDTPATHRYVWWRGPVLGPWPAPLEDGTQPPRPVVTPGEDHYRTDALHPKDPADKGGSGAANQENDFIIATNADAQGVHDLAWRGFANAVIGSLWVRDAAIQSAQIASLTADKITGGAIVGHTIELGTEPGSGVVGLLKSANYVPGVSGWAMDSEGNAEFANLLLREKLSLGTGYFNPDFPDRVFYGRPEIICPIGTYNSGWQQPALSGSPNRQTLHCPDGVPRTRGMVFYYGAIQALTGYSTAKTTPAPWNSPLFFGVDRDDYTFDPGGGNPPIAYLAKPRRLAFDGANVFTVEVCARGNYALSVWYQVADFPVWLAGATIASMGNRRGPNAAPLNAGAPWKFACELVATGGTGYQYLALSQRVEVDVPANKVVLFAVGPVTRNGFRDTTPASWLMYNGFLRVVAENVGNPLPNTDPGEETGD